jgi:hypothetical protein
LWKYYSIPVVAGNTSQNTTVRPQQRELLLVEGNALLLYNHTLLVIESNKDSSKQLIIIVKGYGYDHMVTDDALEGTDDILDDKCTVHRIK